MLGDKIITPSIMREKMLDMLHDGHFGMDKTQWIAQQSVYWPGITNDIKQKARDCQVCQKHQNSLVREPMGEFDIPK